LQNVGMRSPVLVISDRLIMGDRVVWNERDQGQLQTPLDLTVEAVIEHGKITSLTYRTGGGHTQSGVMVPPAWAAGTLGVVGGALVALASIPRRRSERSTLHGRLVTALSESRRQPV
jgi:hypothetical protein